MLIPRSTVPGALWPAIPDAPGAFMLALQYQLGQTQWWSAAELREAQHRQLTLLVRHAAATVPFYRSRLAGVAAAGTVGPEELSRIPLLTRREIQADRHSLASQGIPPSHGRLLQTQSSGSTGEPVVTVHTEASQIFTHAFLLREHLWQRRDFSLPHMAIRAPVESSTHPGWGVATDSLINTGPLHVVGVYTAPDVQLERLRESRAGYLITHPINAHALAQRSIEIGFRLPDLREVRTYGEMLPEGIRAAVRGAWGVPVTDCYSSEELGYMALQCPEHEHYHVMAENLIVEVLDEHGRHCGPGDVGQVVITALHNFAMPYIRYANGDYAEVGGPCPCGRGLPVLKRIVGRSRNMVMRPDGARHWPSFPSREWLPIAPIQQLQLVQDAPDHIEVRMVLPRELTALEEAGLVKVFRKCLGYPFRITLNRVERIERSRGGKFEDFICAVASTEAPASRPVVAPPVASPPCDRPEPSQRPFAPSRAIPRSNAAGIVFPGLPAPHVATMLALHFQLEESQWSPADTLEALQHEQLAQVLRHAFEHVPFHRERLSAAGYRPGDPVTPELLALLPVMTRADVQAQGESLLAKTLPPGHGSVYTAQTSGSTGMPIRHFGTDMIRFLFDGLTLREHLWHRRDFGGKHAVIRIGGRAGDHANWGNEIDGVFPTGPAVLLDIGRSVDEQLDWLARQRPRYLTTHPSNIAALARESLTRGIRLEGLAEVRTIGEMLAPETRELCREAWGVKVVDMYSAGEVGYIALQCPEHDHYHVQSESLLVEVLDDDGRPCLPGAIGRVVITTLHNYAMPLIRYDIGDYAEAGEPCPCGRGLPVLRRIVGRVRNMLVTADGRRYWPGLASRAILDVAPVRQYQLVQKDYGLIEARFVTDAPMSPAQVDRLRQLFLARLPAGVRVDIVRCDSIPRSAGGKFEDFVSEVAIRGG